MAVSVILSVNGTCFTNPWARPINRNSYSITVSFERGTIESLHTSPGNRGFEE